MGQQCSEKQGGGAIKQLLHEKQMNIFYKWTDMFFFLRRQTSLSPARLCVAVSGEEQLVVHVVPSKSALRSEQQHASVWPEQDARSPLSSPSCFLLMAHMDVLLVRVV